MSKRIGELLLDRGLLTKAQLQTALRTQEFFGGHLGSIFIELGFMKEEALGEALAESSNVRYAPPEFLDGIPPEILSLLRKQLAEKYRAVPIRSQNNEIHLAMLHPKDRRALIDIGTATGMTVVPYITPEFRIFDALERYYNVARDRPRRIMMEPSNDPFGTPPPPAPQEAAPEPRVEMAGMATGPSEERGLDGLPLDAEYSMDESFFDLQHTRRETEQILQRLPQDLSDWGNAETAPPGPQGAMHSPPTPLHGPTPTSGMGSASPVAVPEAPEPLAGLNPLALNARRFLEARTRDEIAEVLLQVTQRFFQRRLLFILQRDRIVGWDGCGSGVPRERIKRVLLPMDSLSLFTAVKVGSRPMVGPVADVPANRRLFNDLGMDIPSEVVLLPIRIKGRVVAILYSDNGSQPVGSIDVDLLRRFTMQAAIALEILILRSKLLSF